MITHVGDLIFLNGYTYTKFTEVMESVTNIDSQIFALNFKMKSVTLGFLLLLNPGQIREG